MRLLELKVRGFRNLVATSLEPGPGFNVLWGANGQGKTNVLEAIYSVCTLRSFRVTKLKDTICIGEEQAFVKARVDRRGVDHSYELTQTQKSRRVRMDGKTVRPLHNYFGKFNVVLFAPEDLRIPKASPKERRKFLDRAVFGLRPQYLTAVQDYEKVVQNRNGVLRKIREHGGSADLLDVYDEQVAELGAGIARARTEMIAAIAPLVSQRFVDISGEGLQVRLSYESQWRNDGSPQELLVALRDSRNKDIARGTTSMGPHHDDLMFSLESQNAATFASQGQLRAMSLAWKSSELQLLESELGIKPVLLLDDVSSELDAAKNEKLFEMLEQQAGQVFITTTDPAHVRIRNDDQRRFEVRNGQLVGS